MILGNMVSNIGRPQLNKHMISMKYIMQKSTFVNAIVKNPTWAIGDIFSKLKWQLSRRLAYFDTVLLS